MDILKVARRIVNRCAAINEPVNIVKLQQMLYLVDMLLILGNIFLILLKSSKLGKTDQL